jgi:hypothetical protein
MGPQAWTGRCQMIISQQTSFAPRAVTSGGAEKSVAVFFRMIIADAGHPELSLGCMSINQAVEMAPHDPEIRNRVEGDFQHIKDALTRAISVVIRRPS